MNGMGAKQGAAALHNNVTWITPTLRRVRAEYEEMPGLCLTKRQAAVLWGLDSDSCDMVLDALIDIGYLRQTPGGYVRA